MSDRSPHSLIIHDCPPEEVKAFRDVIAEYQLDEGRVDDRDDRVTLGEVYLTAEWPCGGSSEITGYLAEHAPGATFTVWEDPAYEWLGQVYRHAPELGTWTAECDANGNGVFREAAIVAAVQDDTLGELLGTSWARRIAGVDGRKGEEVVVAPRV